MPLELPVIDDRSFEELLTEAKRRIPAHTPEWTNFEGDSDPGITIVQLFSFLTENLLYRAGRIPDRNRIKFLQLLGIGLQKAAPARGLLVLQNERGPVEALTLDPGVVVSAGAVPFLTRDAVTVLPVEARAYYKKPISDDKRNEDYGFRYAALAAAQAAAKGEPVSVPPPGLKFYESLPMPLPTVADAAPTFDLADTLDGAIYLALLAQPNVGLSDVRNALAGKTLSLGIAPSLAAGVDPLAPRRAFAPPIAPRARLIYEIAVPPDPAKPTAPNNAARYVPLRTVQEADVLTDVGIVQVALPDAAALESFVFTEPLQEGSGDFPPRLEDAQLEARLVTWLRIRIAQPQNGGSVTVRLSYVGINAVRIEQAIPVESETLGIGVGEPDQIVYLTNTPVLTPSVQVAVGNDLYRMTDDLLSAEATDPVFTLDAESGQIAFGDGLRGLRPPRGAVIRARYEYGGGVQGNVGVGAIRSTTDIRLQGGYKVSNPISTYGGDSGESSDEGERQIPLYLRHRDRAVTALDFEDIARRTAGVDVGRAQALPLFHPDLPPTQAVPGVVTLLVLPAYDAKNPLWPTPDRLFLKTVCNYIEERRLITTEVHVVGPVYVPVYVSVGVKVRAGHFRDEVFQAVRDRLNGYLSSLPPGGRDFGGWPLNQRLITRDLEAVVTRVAGVEYVEELLMGVGATTPVDASDLTGLHLPRLDKIGVSEGQPLRLTELFGGAAPVSSKGDFYPVPVARTRC